MIPVILFISCASDADHLRDIAADVMTRLTQMFTSQTPWPLMTSTNGTIARTPAGPFRDELAARSLEELRKSEGVVALFSARVGKIASEEIHAAFSIAESDPGFEILPYVDEAKKGPQHEALMHAIARDHKPLTLVYTPYVDEQDFQAKLFTALVPYLLKRTGVFVPPRILAASHEHPRRTPTAASCSKQQVCLGRTARHRIPDRRQRSCVHRARSGPAPSAPRGIC